MNEEQEVIKKEAAKLAVIVGNTIVKNEEDLQAVSDKVKEVKKLKQMIEEKKEQFTAPAKDIIANARAIYDPFIKECQRFESELKDRATVYIVDRNKRITDDKAKIAEKVDKGQIKTETAVRRLEKLPEESKSVSTGKSTLSVRMIKDIEIVDEQQIPREYLVPDLKKIRAVVVAGVEVAGVKLIEKPSTSIR